MISSAGIPKVVVFVFEGGREGLKCSLELKRGTDTLGSDYKGIGYKVIPAIGL